MPLPRPKEHVNEKNKYKAYRARRKAEKAVNEAMASVTKSITAIAAEKGLIPLLSDEPVSAAIELMEVLRKLDPVKVEKLLRD